MLVARKASGCVPKCIFDQIEANLAEIQPKNLQNVQKLHFLQKAPGVNGLMKLHIFAKFSTVNQEVYFIFLFEWKNQKIFNSD